MNITGMLDRLRDVWLEAIDELIAHYKGEPGSEICPLCPVCNNCDECLWMIIEGYYCADYPWGENNIGMADKWDGNYEEWKSHRLKMLGRWREIIKGEKK